MAAETPVNKELACTDMALNACTHSHIPFFETDLSATTTFWQCTFQKLQARRENDARNCMEK